MKKRSFFVFVGKIVGAFIAIIGFTLGLLDYIECKPWEEPSGCPWQTDNKLPIVQADQVQTYENQTVHVDVLANDSSEKAGSLKIHTFTSPLHGQITLSKNLFRYEPPIDFVGEDFFGYTIIDNEGNESQQAQVQVLISPLPSNHPPVAYADKATTTSDQSIEIDVLANDIDLDKDLLKIIAISRVPKGEVTLAGDKLHYRPDSTFVGKDKFTYRISDGSDHVAQAQVIVTILPPNRPPPAQLDQFEIAENQTHHPPIARPDQAQTQPGTAISIDVLSNDSDSDQDPIQIISFSGALNGQVTLLENQTLRYTPYGQFIGNDYFSYVIEDSHGDSAEAKVTVTVFSSVSPPQTTRDSPIESADSVITSANQAVDIDVFSEYQIISINNASNGEVTFLSAEKLRYTPHLNFVGTDQFSYLVDDNQGKTVKIKVTVKVE